MDTSDEGLLISVLVVVRNERQYIRCCLHSILSQDFPQKNFEILVIDGMSSDGTREEIQKVIIENADFRIKMLDNPGKILSCGWNIGVNKARGKYVVRPDAHATIPPGFLTKSLRAIQEHPEAWAVGGTLETVGIGFWGQAIAGVLSCRMGVGGSTFRVGGKQGPADTVVFGLYQRERLMEIGGFDETIPLNQDNVCHGNILQRGGVLYFDPSIRSTYYCRSNLQGLWKQMIRRSYWLILMLKHQAPSLRLRYLVPLVFVLCLLLTAILGFIWSPAFLMLIGILSAYVGAGWIAALKMKTNNIQKLITPLIFFTTHTAYGIGMMAGLVVLPFYKPKKRTDR